MAFSEGLAECHRCFSGQIMSFVRWQSKGSVSNKMTGRGYCLLCQMTYWGRGRDSFPINDIKDPCIENNTLTSNSLSLQN